MSTSPSHSLPIRYTTPDSGVVSISYTHLLRSDADLSASIAAAFGSDGIGLLTVSDIPEYPARRDALLPLAARFARLPVAVQQRYEDAASMYSFGWSLGREQLNNKPDTAKGSFYNNPLYDDPLYDSPLPSESEADRQRLKAQHRSFFGDNVWPTDELPELETAFKALGRLIVSVGAELSRHIDRYIHAQLPAYPSDHLHRVITTSRVAKARLLHYFPLQAADSHSAAVTAASDEAVTIDSHCGWHNDHGSLTGLTCAQWRDDDSGQQLPSSPDPTAGLYVLRRDGRSVQVSIPPHSLAFQLGECQMIHSGATVQATPHAVRASPMPSLSRQTFAVFMEPEPHFPMSLPGGVAVERLLTAKALLNLPAAVPRMDRRWRGEDDFGQFTTKTLTAYHPNEAAQAVEKSDGM